MLGTDAPLRSAAGWAHALVLQQHPPGHPYPQFVPYPSVLPISLVFSPCNFHFFWNPNLELPHSFFKPLFLPLNLDFYSYNVFPFICSNSEHCQLRKYPSPDETTFASLVTLPGFLTTTAASFLLFIIHISSCSSWLDLSCSAHDCCRHAKVLTLQRSSSTH